MRLACLVLFACALAAGSTAPPVSATPATPAVSATPGAPAVPAAAVARAAAPSAAARTLSARTRAVAARLRVTADFAPRRTTVAFRGTARVRRSGVALVVIRCADARCVRYARRGRALRRLPRGRRRLSLRLRVGPSPYARVEVRVRRRVVAHATLRRPIPRPPAPAPTPPPATAPVPAPFSTTPPLSPAYDSAIPDYTVVCEPARTVRVVDDGGTRTLPLSAGESFAFTVGGRSHTARCLPRTWTGWTVTRDGTPQSEWIVFNTPAGYTVIADGHGVPVWWRAGVPPLQDGRVLPDGSVAVGHVTEGSWGRAPYERVALDGSPLGSLDTVGTSADPHELQILPNGNALMMRYVRRDGVDLTSLGGPADATVLDGEIQEVAPDRQLVWSWNSADHIAAGETSFPLASIRTLIDGQLAYDLVHLNSLQADGDGVLFSARNLNAVYRIRRDGSVDWKLGGSARVESLDFLAGPFGAAALGGQHQAVRLPDGTITLQDNGSGQGRPPRALRFALDPLARTATVIERVVDPRVPNSICCGGATRLAGGHWLVSWGYSPLITELTAAGRPVLTLKLDTGFSYRAQSVSSALLSRAALRAGMDAMVSRRRASGPSPRPRPPSTAAR